LLRENSSNKTLQWTRINRAAELYVRRTINMEMLLSLLGRILSGEKLEKSTTEDYRQWWSLGIGMGIFMPVLLLTDILKNDSPTYWSMFFSFVIPGVLLFVLIKILNEKLSYKHIRSLGVIGFCSSLVTFYFYWHSIL
jgi:hypothetical protein